MVECFQNKVFFKKTAHIYWQNESVICGSWHTGLNRTKTNFYLGQQTYLKSIPKPRLLAWKDTWLYYYYYFIFLFLHRILKNKTYMIHFSVVMGLGLRQTHLEQVCRSPVEPIIYAPFSWRKEHYTHSSLWLIELGERYVSDGLKWAFANFLRVQSPPKPITIFQLGQPFFGSLLDLGQYR